MELCMEAKALKSSLRGELAVNSSQRQQKVLFDDFGVVSPEDFEVDDLLDLSSGEFEEGFGKKLEDEDFASLWVDDVTDLSFAGGGDPDDFLSGELAVPDDDIAELEWVSRFVDDSVPELSLLYPVGPQSDPMKRNKPGLLQSVTVKARPCSVNFPQPVPVKARTKRPRATGRAWSLGSDRSSSPTSSDSSGFSSSTSCLISGEAPVRKPGAKKQRRKKPAAPEGEEGQFGRRCSHCLVQKTPQWRTGPGGPKTLCNACGVRFKSGRLFPEYRPACSPTFSREAHSNSHRKVLEMRKRKAVVVRPESELAMVTMIQSF